MVSATTKPQKRLGDFLNEQQEPFIQELYLVERDYSKGWRLKGDSSNSLERSANCGLNKMRKRKVQFPFCNALTTLLNKFAFHGQSNTLTREFDQRKKHASTNHIVQFSSARKSCLDIVDEEDNCISSNKDQHSFSSHINQTCNVWNMRWQKQRSIEGSIESIGNIPPLPRKPNAHETVNEDVGVMQHGVQSCGVLRPKKITNSVISVAIWNLIAPSVKKEECAEELQEVLPKHDVSQILKSKRVSQNIKKQPYDCVRDGTMNFPTKDDRKQVCIQFMGPLEVGKLSCQRTKELGQQHARGGVNVNRLLTLDYLDSNIEWSKFETYVQDIGVEISDEILECMNNEIVSEMIGTLAPKGFIFPPGLYLPCET